MQVDHLTYYLIYQEGATWRDQDYRANKIVKCVKNESFKGTFQDTVCGTARTFNFGNRSEFLKVLWPCVAKRIVANLTGNATLVPIPNSDAIVDTTGEYKTLQYARAIARHSNGRLTATDALRWQEQQEPQHKSSGWRTPEQRFANLKLIATPTPPVVLFDDFFTSGSSLVAAYWILDDAGAAPARAVVIGRRTDTQHDKMTGWNTEELDIPWRLPFIGTK